MIVTSAVRHAAAGATALVLALQAPAALAATVTEPTPPPRSSVDPTELYRPGTHVRRLPGAPALPDGVSALAWVVADARTGEVLAARDAHRRLPPASTMKALFALTALPRLRADLRHKVTEEELDGIGAGSSLVGVQPGHTYKVSDLWNGVFLSSGNDAVRVLAALDGGWEGMARKMQEKAAALGAKDTRVVSPDGYDAPGQVSSAYDLAVFGRAGLRNPDFARYSATPYAYFPGGSSSYGIRNTNRLLTGDDGVGRYPGLLGVKNGYTSAAGSTLIAAAERGGRTLVVTVMNPQSGGGLAVYEEARRLLDWGFEAAGKVRPVGTLRPGPAERSEQAAAQPASGPVRAAAADAAASAAERAGDSDRKPAAAALAEAKTEPEGGTGFPVGFVGSALAAAAGLWWWHRRTGASRTTGGDG
ncbi:D-alanyl-D-alanine carboxypeptidase family protein [Streptomyces tritici]|uniref:D-alanyl-D-alanine carboxypeptidase family protein n=1 Tax=Streptomyces tritici TaxID=2054410 RepID=UPI003AF007F6